MQPIASDNSALCRVINIVTDEDLTLNIILNIFSGIMSQSSHHSSGLEIRKIWRSHFRTRVFVTKREKMEANFSLCARKKSLVFHLQSELIVILMNFFAAKQKKLVAFVAVLAQILSPVHSGDQFFYFLSFSNFAAA